jgi:DNA-directed RNA polymerase beta' subunit
MKTFKAQTTSVMDASKKVTKLKFGLSTPEDIIAYSVCNITSTESFENGQPKFGGLFDLRMGTIDKDKPCLTCRQSRLYCVSHFGRVELAKKCYWPQNIPTIIQVFQVACLTCKHILDPSCEKFKNKKKNNKLLSAVQKQCSKIKVCMRHTSTTMLTGRVVDGTFAPGCYEDDENGVYLKKYASGKDKCVCDDEDDCSCVPEWIPHELPKGWLSCETFPVDQSVMEMEYKVPSNTPVPRFKRENLTLIKTVNGEEDVVLAATCEELLKSIDREVFEIIGINPDKVTGLICSVLPVLPPAGRPSVHNGQMRSEDDLTFKYGEIVKANNRLQVMMVQTDNKIEKIHEKMSEITKYDGRDDLSDEEVSEFKKMKKRNKKLVDEIDKLNLVLNDYYGHLQYHIFTLVDNNMPGIPPSQQRTGRPLNSIKGRISGKEGRARNNLMGKRVDFSARTVIDGDPMISIGDVGVPFEIAMELTIAETINEYNEQRLRACVSNGPHVHPGANFIFLRRGGKEYRKNLKHIVKKILFPFETDLTISGPDDDFIVLRYGDVVERHLIDGDMVLLNRQPSLHRMNIMAHNVVTMHHKSLRLNPDACSPYNADFDGDEMNLHVPISSVTQYEAKNMMSVQNHFISPQSNRPCMGATMDTALGLRMFVRETVLLSKYEVLDLMSNVKSFNGNLPQPIDREQMLWNGLQIFSLLLPDINYYERDDDGNICTLIKAGKFVRGIVNKRMVGTGSRGLVQIIVNDHGGERAKLFFNDIHQLVNKWMMTIGFSVGISDVIPDRYTDRKVEYNIETAKTFVRNTIQQMSTIEHVETEDIIRADFESKVIQCLNIVRDSSGGIASKNLTDANSIKQMVSISKGSFINVSQIMASVGQQNVSHNKTTGRVPDYYEGRPLPHVEKYDVSPEARGFVEDSYKTGLTALEFFFHAMAGREGMIDTSIKSVTRDTPIIITVNGVPKRVCIGEWIDDQLDIEDNKANIKYHDATEANMELLDIDEMNVYIPTTSSKGNMSWEKVTKVTRHDPSEHIYQIKTKYGREVKVVESKSLLIWNGSEYCPKDMTEVKVGDNVPVCLNLSGDVDFDDLVLDDPLGAYNAIMKFSNAEESSTQMSQHDMDIVSMKLNQNGIFTEMLEDTLTCDPTKQYKIQEDTILDEIISITKFKSTDHPKVYDLTVPSTNNFGLANGLQVYDTAETGYIQRQLVKILEDVVISYDLVVRNETGHLTEYLCGGDGLDPCSIEKQPIPAYMKDMKVFEAKFKCMEDGKFVNEPEYTELLKLKKIFEDDYFHKENISLPINVPRIIKNTKNQKSKKKTECDMDPETVFDMITMFCEELDLYVNRNNPLMIDMNYHATMLLRIIIHMELSYPIISKNNIDYDTLTEILTYIKDKFYKSVAHPGSSAGVITAQSLGEPVMQCTLNSFHHTGMATKQVTNGVVRIKELITLSKKPKNRSMDVYFNNNLSENEITTYNKQFAYTYLGDIIVQTKIFYDPDIMNSTLEEADWMKYDYSMFNPTCSDINYSMYVIRVEMCSFEMFNRSLSMYYIYKQLKETHSKKNLHIMFTDDNDDRLFMYIRYTKNCTFKEITALLATISNTIVCGINGVNRTYVKKETVSVFENGTLVDKEEITVETDGSNLKYVLGLPYVDSTRTISDDLNEVIEVFGIFAGANILHKEQNKVLENAGISIDHRHFELLSKAMICSGTFLPVNRHGGKKGSKGPVSRLTFEETCGEVTKAAIHDEVDMMTGVSANIIMAQLPPLGTGICDIAIDLNMVERVAENEEPDHKTTLPVLFRNEKTKMIGVRIAQLDSGAQTQIKRLDFPKQELFTTENIALMELERNILPLKIIRNLPGGKKEYWKTSEFETIV